MKTIVRIALLAFYALVSAFLILSGLGQGPTDAPTKSTWEVVIGLVIFPSLLVLALLGKSHPKTEKVFWYLSIAIGPIGWLIMFNPFTSDFWR